VIPLGGDPWTISTSTDPNIDFTVWILHRDGLRAGVFSWHPDGDGSLRRAGLTAEVWLSWFQRVVRAASQRANAVRGDPAAIRQRGNPNLEVGRAQTAAGMFRAPDATRDLLLEIWPAYLLRSREKADRGIARIVERQNRLTEEDAEALVTRERQFWDDLQAYRPLPSLQVYLVEYVKPVVTVVPPDAAVIGFIDPQEDDLGKYSSLVLEGASLLKQAK